VSRGAAEDVGVSEPDAKTSGAGATRSANVWAVLLPNASVTVMVGAKPPSVPGKPLITPLVASIANPGGRPSALQRTGSVPPGDASALRYSVPS
jgi:hypothetical protein